MPIIGILRIGMIIFVAGVILRYVTHLWWPLVLLGGLGFGVFIIAVMLWSLDSSGDVSFD